MGLFLDLYFHDFYHRRSSVLARVRLVVSAHLLLGHRLCGCRGETPHGADEELFLFAHQPIGDRRLLLNSQGAALQQEKLRPLDVALQVIGHLQAVLDIPPLANKLRAAHGFAHADRAAPVRVQRSGGIGVGEVKDLAVARLLAAAQDAREPGHARGNLLPLEPLGQGVDVRPPPRLQSLSHNGLEDLRPHLLVGSRALVEDFENLKPLGNGEDGGDCAFGQAKQGIAHGRDGVDAAVIVRLFPAVRRGGAVLRKLVRYFCKGPAHV